MLSLTGLTPSTNDAVIPGGYYLLPDSYKVTYDDYDYVHYHDTDDENDDSWWY